jgi:hypothetical protein
MRSFDFAPYYRSTVGFDRLFSMLDQVGGVERRKVFDMDVTNLNSNSLAVIGPHPVSTGQVA